MTAHPERISDYLQHILDAINRACGYIARVDGFDAFERDFLVQDGVVRAIEVIGEAAVKVQQSDPGLVSAHPEIPWKDMRTMRNKVIHDYFDVDLKIVWSTVKQDLPGLSEKIAALLQSFSSRQ